MSLIEWDKTGERYYETGVSHGVLYPIIGSSDGAFSGGVPWNGLISVTQSPSGAETTPLYADDIKYLNLMSAEDFACTIEAYTCPEEFAECDGTASIADGIILGQQKRKPFGFSYRTVLGNDVDESDYGYKIHLVYNAIASPAERAYSTINDSPEAMTLSWEVSTTPIVIAGYKPTAIITIDSTKVDGNLLSSIEKILYGTDDTEPRLVSPNELSLLISL